MTKREAVELFKREVMAKFVEALREQMAEERKVVALGCRTDKPSDAALVLEVTEEFIRHVEAFDGCACACQEAAKHFGFETAQDLVTHVEILKAAAEAPCEECGHE